MKKLLLAFAFLLSANLFAQTKDMSITMVKPGPGDKVISGQPMNIEYIITNAGTVPTLTTDSMIVLYYINNSAVTTLPGQSPVVYTNRVMNAGDTIWRKFTLAITFNGMSGATSVPICYKLYAQSGNVTIDPNQTNNTSCNNVVANVSEVERALESLKVFPNPAFNTMNISFDYADARQINILDLNGKVLESVKKNSLNTELNVSNLSNGIYIYQINAEDGSLIKSGKFTVDK